MRIRARVDNDIDSLCELIRCVHRIDGYPVELQADVQSFIVTSNCYAAWVAEEDGAVIGHASLHSVWSDAVADAACAELQCSRDVLAAVSRLFVAPSARGAGVGRSLLDVAASEARLRSLHAVLDVVTTSAPAIAMYERAGWDRIGVVTLDMPSGEPIQEYVYAGPPADG